MDHAMKSALLALLLLAATAVQAATKGTPLPPSPPRYGFEVEEARIQLGDGTRLAATLYRPAGAKRGERFPALLEYLPYRKDDDTLTRDPEAHAWFARRGYVSVRVDIRGFGNSEGHPTDREYSAQEQRDGEEVIAWLARQPWSNGKVGMFGISWGGFNSIQMALRRPPALKAIIAVDATEALYTEDVHYFDGIFHVDEFELTMDLDIGRTGAPHYPLDEATLGPRFDAPPWSLAYMEHQRDSAFWHAPIVRPIDTLAVPAFLIGGLQDGYRDSVPRMLERVKGTTVKAWIGPWNHSYPNGADYGPLYEWRDEAVRWFDYWLKGRDTGVLADPKLLAYVQHWHRPGTDVTEVPGEWRADTWPPRGLEPTPYYLQPRGQLEHAAGGNGLDRLAYVPSAGAEAGFWWGEMMPDQRPIDAYSLVYDSAPLDEEVRILGRPGVLLQASADAPQADWFVRLSDVAPDGQVTAVTGGGINGAQRDSLTEPAALEPGHEYALRLELHLTSWVFPKGHRIRVAVSNAIWPMLWPTPDAMATTLRLGGVEPSRIVLPRIPADSGLPLPPLAPPGPVDSAPGVHEGAYAWPGKWTVTRDENRRQSVANWEGHTQVDYPWGALEHTERLRYEVDDAHPEAARISGECIHAQKADGHLLEWHGELDVRSDATTFHYSYTRTLSRDGVVLRTRHWEKPIPRDHQ